MCVRRWLRTCDFFLNILPQMLHLWRPFQPVHKTLVPGSAAAPAKLATAEEAAVGVPGVVGSAELSSATGAWASGLQSLLGLA